MNLRKIRIATLITLALGAGITAALVLYLWIYGFFEEAIHEGHWDWSRLLLSAGVLFWAVLPYLVLYWGTAVLVRGAASAVTFLIASLGIGVAGLGFYFDAFV